MSMRAMIYPLRFRGFVWGYDCFVKKVWALSEKAIRALQRVPRVLFFSLQ